MRTQGYRSLFAILGIICGMVVMISLGFGGLIPGFIFGAGGAVGGGMLGERIARGRGGQ